MFQKKKETRYPSKKYMNLYYKPDRKTVPAAIALYVLFAVVVLIGVSKFLIYDKYAQVAEKREEAAALEEQMNQYMLQLSDYSSVQEEYYRYAATEEEEAQVDRLEILKLLDQAVSPSAKLSSLEINGHSVLVQYSSVTLKQSADILRELEKSPLVAKTSANTASASENDRVRADILIELVSEEEDAE